MRYTVVGFYDDSDTPQVAGVIEGEHMVSGGEDSGYQPWALHVDADDETGAEAVGLAEIREENGW